MKNLMLLTLLAVLFNQNAVAGEAASQRNVATRIESVQNRINAIIKLEKFGHRGATGPWGPPPTPPELYRFICNGSNGTEGNFNLECQGGSCTLNGVIGPQEIKDCAARYHGTHPGAGSLIYYQLEKPQCGADFVLLDQSTFESGQGRAIIVKSGRTDSDAPTSYQYLYFICQK